MAKETRSENTMCRLIRIAGFWFAVATGVSSPFVRGQSTDNGIARKHTPFVKEGTPRRPERIRFFDVKHIKAELAVDTKNHKICGTVTHTISPLHPFLSQLELDCGPDLKVSAVTAGPRAEPCTFETKQGKLSIKLAKAYVTNESFDVAISYSGSPSRGLYFVDPAGPYPKKGLSFWTQGESEDTRFWLPCYDYPNERAKIGRAHV